MLISPDQTGFMKGRMAADNIRRLLHVIDATSDSHGPRAVFSLDAEKAFDRIEWDYVWAVLGRMGFGDTFLGMLRTLYKGSSSSVLTGSTISQPFQLERSKRQGCPLSPLLFCLSLEPLAQAIRQSPLISPIMLHGHAHHISLYADDILLYLDNLSSSVPQVLDLFANFGSLSGYKINWMKSAMMLLNTPAKNTPLPPHITLCDRFVYLGINIRPALTQVIRDNFDLIFSRVRLDLQRWDRLKKPCEHNQNECVAQVQLFIFNDPSGAHT